MQFNKHSNVSGTHALLSPSSYHWVNYDEDKMEAKISSSFAAQRGTEQHEVAQRLIKLGINLPDTQQTLNAYVNDAIGFRMTPEQTLFYSWNCYGTADAISFVVRKDGSRKLRIHDLKTGVTATSVKQLEVYGALFCLEYGHKPTDLEMEFRIYQNDEVRIYDGDPLSVTQIMDQIVFFDELIEKRKREAYG